LFLSALTSSLTSTLCASEQDFAPDLPSFIGGGVTATADFEKLDLILSELGLDDREGLSEF